MAKLIRSLKIPAADKNRLLKLTPETYTGAAEKLVDEYELDILAMSGSGGCSGGDCSSCQGCG